MGGAGAMLLLRHVLHVFKHVLARYTGVLVRQWALGCWGMLHVLRHVLLGHVLAAGLYQVTMRQGAVTWIRLLPGGAP
jgi:hypothetical protein